VKLTKKQYLYRGIFLILTGLTILLYMFIYNVDIKEHSKSFFYMDTYINVKIYSNNTRKVNEAMLEVDKIYEKYHKLTNRYDSYPNITNIYYINNNLGMNEKIKIEKELYNIIDYAIDAYYESNGLFNIALGNAIDVWRSYRIQGHGVPTYSELSNIGSLSIDDIILHDDYMIEIDSNVKIDLGAISKGYTTEIVGNYLESVGLDKYIINAGGSVKVGNHYDNEKYKIGIKDPQKGGNEIFKVVNGNNISVVTSGSYERYYEYNNEVYHHIIDPKTLYPPRNFLAVTVISKDSKMADILSTVVFLMPFDEGKEYIDSLINVEAIWYKNNGQIHYSEGFNIYE